MLTCKSLFGLGYRGERLIEPFSELSVAWWLRVRPKVDASHFQSIGVAESKWQDRQIAGTRCKANNRAAQGKPVAALKVIT